MTIKLSAPQFRALLKADLQVDLQVDGIHQQTLKSLLNKNLLEYKKYPFSISLTLTKSGQQELRRRGILCPLTPRQIATLAYMVDNNGILNRECPDTIWYLRRRGLIQQNEETRFWHITDKGREELLLIQSAAAATKEVLP